MTDTITSASKGLPRWLIPGGIALAVVIALFTVWGMINGIRNEAVNREVEISATYQQNQNDLSAFISEFYEVTGIADRKSAQMNTILENAVTGRYGDDGFSANGALFSAISEAYPDLKGLDIYDTIIETIRGGRASFKNKQDNLLDKLRSYDTWRQQGILRSWALNQWAPSQNLKARVNGQTLTGQAALDKMYQIVLIKDASKAFESGEMDALQAPPLPANK